MNQEIVLIADGGDVTVGRERATLVYGEFNVVLPEGAEQVERDDRIKDGYIYRPSETIARFDVGFARADTTIDLELQISDLETVVDTVQRQIAGDTFFERDITTGGLRGYIPGEDFQVGDVVTVEIRGRRLRLPVTEITMVSSDDYGIGGWRVHVGGLLISDADALRRQSQDLRRQVANDKRALTRRVAGASKTATAAKTTADQASQLAHTAGTTATTALQSADNKSTNYYGPTTPKNPKQGDTWFKETPTGTIIYQYRNNQWTQHLNTDTLNHELDQARRAVEDAAAKVKKLQDEELPQLAQDLAQNKRLVDDAAEKLKKDLQTKLRQLDEKLEKFPKSLTDARKELDAELAGLSSSLDSLGSGNLFPDPHFQDACWGTSGDVYSQRNINGGELRIYSVGRQVGRYFQPKGKQDTSMVLEPSAAYRLAAAAWCSNDFDGQFFNMYMRYKNTRSEMRIFRVANVALASSGTRPVSATFVAPGDMLDGSCTLGFFLENNASKGRISLWNMTVVRASDASLITDGAVKTQHMVAGTIDGDRIRANTLHANRIVARSLTSQQIAADAIMAVNIAANQITAKQLSAGAVTADKIAANQVTAVKLAAGAVTADKIQSGSVLTKHIKAGQVTAGALAAGAVTADKIAARALTSDKMVIANGFIRTAMVADGQITNAKVANLDAGKITSGFIDAGRIRAGSIDASKIKADSITVKELRAGTIVPLGASLVHAEPKVSGGVPEPIWWQVCNNELEANYSGWPRPQGHPWRMCSAAASKDVQRYVPKRLMKVQPGKKYRVRFWARATKANTKLFVALKAQDGSDAVASGSVQSGSHVEEKWGTWNGWQGYRQDHSKNRSGGFLLWDYTVPDRATLVETVITLNPSVEYVYLDEMTFNHGWGKAKANQWLAGLSIDLDVVDQEQVDALQSKQITDNSNRIREIKAAQDKAQKAINAEEKYRTRFGSGGNHGYWFSPSGNQFVEVTTFRNGASVRYNSTRARLKRDCKGWILLMQTTESGLADMCGFNVSGKRGDTFDLIGGLNQVVSHWIIFYQLYA